MTYLFHGFGLAALGLGVFTIAVSYVPYRKGEKWAWYITWYLPIFLLLATIANYADGGRSWALSLVLLIVALAGLLLPYRKFYPKK
jgi:FtsH-binding integral membrane protein